MEKHQFKDLNGNVWSIKITVKEYMAIKDECGIDLGRIFEQDSDWIQDIISQEDIVKFMSLIGICTDPQREKLDMSMEDFYAGLGGDVLEQAAVALIEGIVNFTPAHKREPLRRMVATSNRALEKVSEKVLEAMDETKMDEMIDKALNDQMKS